jgi:carotenoid cleavage dioxygenase-like enzyme
VISAWWVDRAVYGAVMPAADQPGKAGQFVGIAKMDLSAKGVDKGDDAVVAQISYGEGRYGGEAVFVPRFGHTNVLDAGCDEGFLITFVFDEVRTLACTASELGELPRMATDMMRASPRFQVAGASEMVIYDSKTMSSEPVASIHLNRRVPFGFHALWVDAEKLKTQPHTLAADEA